MDITDLNPKVVSWLESGKIKEALLGSDDFFLMNHTYRDSHDVLLVMHVLLLWSQIKNNQKDISSALSQILDSLKHSGNVAAVNDIELAYRVVSKSTGIQLENNSSGQSIPS